MNKYYLKIFALLLTLIVLNACSMLKKEIKPDLDQTPYTDLLKIHADWQASIQTMQANTRITLDTPAFSGNFFADVVHQKPDSLLVTVQGAFGMQIGKVFLAHRRFIFYNQIANQFFKGNKSDFEGRNFLQFPIEISRLGDVFIANDNFDILRMKSFSIRDNAYYLEAEDGSITYHIWFAAASKMITKIEYYKEGNLLFRKEYKEWREEDGVLFPHLVNFVKPQSTEGLSVFFTTLSFNKPIKREAFTIKIPADAKQTTLSL